MLDKSRGQRVVFVGRPERYDGQEPFFTGDYELKLRSPLSLAWSFVIAVVAVTAEADQPPVLHPIGPKAIVEGKRLFFVVSASDQDGTTPRMSWLRRDTLHDSLGPPIHSFTDNGNGTGTFDWWSKYDDAGTYLATFYAYDDIDKLWDSEQVTIDVAEEQPYDPAVRDTLELVVTVRPDEGDSQYHVQLELYVFNDSTIIGAAAGFSWDNPNLHLDSAKPSSLTGSGFGWLKFFRAGNLDSSNFHRQFEFMGGTQFGGTGVPPAAERQHWATYYFTLSDWSIVDSVVIDTMMVPPSDSLLFTVKDTTEWRQQALYVPEWTGKLVIKDASDVRIADGEGLPKTFSLSQNYPNPFNPTTQIAFEIPVRSQVTLTIYNVLGQKVTSLLDTEMPAGRYVADWNSTSDSRTEVASGIYFYKLEAGDFVRTKKMILLK